VIALAERHQCRDPVIARGVAVVERLVAEPVCEGVDAECGLLYESGTENTCVDESADWGYNGMSERRGYIDGALGIRGVLTPVAPSQAADKTGKDQGHENNAFLREKLLAKGTVNRST
jgi:hypothetical protein